MTLQRTPAFSSKLLSFGTKAYFYFFCQAYSFGELTKSYIGYRHVTSTTPVGSTGQMQLVIDDWNRRGFPLEGQRAYRYALRYTEEQAKAQLMKEMELDFGQNIQFRHFWANLTKKTFSQLSTEHQKLVTALFGSTLTLCDSVEAFFDKLINGPRLYWYNPTRTGQKQTLREFCFYNGFAALADMKVQQADKTFYVHPDSVSRTDNWLKESDILTYSGYLLPYGGTEPRTGNTLLYLDSYIAE